MSKLDFLLEKKLEIPAFSQENLSNLIKNNKGILEKKLDTSAKISIQIEANLDLDIRVDANHYFSVPAYYLPIERYGLNEKASKIFKEALDIQRKASGDIPEHQHHYGHSIFRKLSSAIVRLEKLRRLPEIETANYFETRDLYDAQSFINRLLEDAKKKLSNTSIQWEYKAWGSLGDDFKRFESKKLSELIGGKELYNQAVEQSLEFDVFEYIDDYDKKNKASINEEELINIATESKKLSNNGILEEVVYKKANKPQIENKNKKPIVLSLSSDGEMTPPASNTIASSLFDYDDEAFNLIKINNMRNFVWVMSKWKKEDLLKNVKYIIINSAPPYFGRPSLEEFELMKKYGIYNRGLTSTILDYDGGCTDDIKGIVRLIKGEYPELPKPVVLCDGRNALNAYVDANDDYIVFPIDVNDYRKKINEIKLSLAKKQ